MEIQETSSVSRLLLKITTPECNNCFAIIFRISRLLLKSLYSLLARERCLRNSDAPTTSSFCNLHRNNHIINATCNTSNLFFHARCTAIILITGGGGHYQDYARTEEEGRVYTARLKAAAPRLRTGFSRYITRPDASSTTPLRNVLHAN